MYLLRLEWLKWRRHRFFQLLLGAYVLLLPSILLTMRHLPETPWVSPRIFYIFPTVWGFLGYVGNWMAFFCFGFLSIGIMTVEQGYRTQRQNIITGLSRGEYLRGKIAFIAAIALAATLYYVACALLIGWAHTESLRWSKVWQEAAQIPTYFLMCMGYMLFGLLLGVLIRRTGIAIFAYFGYILFLETVVRYYLLFELKLGPNTRYFPLNVIEDLAPVPSSRIAEEFLTNFGFSMFLTLQQATIAGLLYMSLFVMLAWWRLRRVDL